VFLFCFLTYGVVPLSHTHPEKLPHRVGRCELSTRVDKPKETNLVCFVFSSVTSAYLKYAGTSSSMIGRTVYLIGYGDFWVEFSQLSQCPSVGGRLPRYIALYDDRALLNSFPTLDPVETCTNHKKNSNQTNRREA